MLKFPTSLIPSGWDFGQVIYGLDPDDVTTYPTYAHDKAIKDWVGSILTNNRGEHIPVISSPPKTAFSEYHKLLAKHMPHAVPKSTEQLARFPLPMSSIFLKDRKLHRTHRQPLFPIRNIRFEDDKQHHTSYTRHPKPMALTYQIDIWTNHRTTMERLWHIMERQFWETHAHTKVQHPFLKTTISLPLKRVSHQDLTQYDRGPDDGDILFHHVWEVETDPAWIFDELLAAPTVHKNIDELVDHASGEVVGERSFTHSELIERMVPQSTENPSDAL